MDNTLKHMSYTEQMQGSLFPLKTSWHLSHAMKECQVANFHGQASDAYAYVWMVQGILDILEYWLSMVTTPIHVLSLQLGQAIVYLHASRP
jgi:hypothetical protein